PVLVRRACPQGVDLDLGAVGPVGRHVQFESPALHGSLDRGHGLPPPLVDPSSFRYCAISTHIRASRFSSPSISPGRATASIPPFSAAVSTGQGMCRLYSSPVRPASVAQRAHFDLGWRHCPRSGRPRPFAPWENVAYRTSR